MIGRWTALALEHGVDDVLFRFKLWFGKAFDLAKGIADFAGSTLARTKRAMVEQLTELLAATTTSC